MSSEHVEVLWAMLRKCVNERLARKSADREAGALAAAIEALKSAPQPPAEAMEAWHSAMNDVGELRANAPDERYAKRAARVESWIKANRPSPPSAPVGVEGLIEEWESNLAEDRRDGVAEVAIRAQEIQLDQLRALAQQGGAE